MRLSIGAVEFEEGAGKRRGVGGRQPQIGQRRGIGKDRIGHRLAQAAANIEAAWSLTLHAAWALDNAPELARNAALMAKASAGDAAIYACEACVQTHGGMGITREADPHLYLKRAFAIDAAWGRSAELNREIGDALLLA